MTKPTTSRPEEQAGVILLGTDTPIGLAVVRDLGRHGYRVIGIGRRQEAIAGASRYCRHHVVRAPNECDLVAQIEALARDHRARYLLAVGESDLMLLNRHRRSLESALDVLVPDPARLSQVIDKAACQEHAKAVGIAVPRSWHFTSLDEAREAAGNLPYPVVLKWADPHKVSRALEDHGLPLVKTSYAHEHSDLVRQLAPYAAVGAFPMVQEYCPGHGIGQMFLARDGKVLMAFQHERLHEWPPEGGASTLCRSVPLHKHSELQKRSRALLQRLRWTGVAMVEYRYDPATGRAVFMEVNGRFWGSLPLAIAAGLPFAAGLVAHCGSEQRALPLPQDYPTLTACYWIPETKRLLRVLFQRKRIQDPFYRPDPLRSLLLYLTLPLRPSSRWFVFQLTDPRPLFADLASIMAKLRPRRSRDRCG